MRVPGDSDSQGPSQEYKNRYTFSFWTSKPSIRSPARDYFIWRSTMELKGPRYNGLYISSVEATNGYWWMRRAQTMLLSSQKGLKGAFLDH